MALDLNDIAVELLRCIFRFCSQSDLTSLSQVNTTFRHIAEDILYRHIYTSFCPYDLVDIPDNHWHPESWAITEKSLFHTLASNPQKAALLRSFHIQFRYSQYFHGINAVRTILGRIADALHNAPDLVDLRILVEQNLDASEGKFSEAIKTGCFQLHTLYCESFQDLEGIIISQKHLRLLGIYDTRKYGCPPPSDARYVIQNLRNHRNLPGIFGLGSYGVYDKIQCPRLSLFPELCRPGQAFTLCRDIVTSLGQDLGKRYDIGPIDAHHWDLEIQVVDFSYAKAAMICEVVEAMAECFVGCHGFSVRMETSTVEGMVSKPWRTPGLLTAISRFKQLQYLTFYHHGDGSLRQMAMDMRSLLLNELIPACPTLVEAHLKKTVNGAYISLNSGWKVVIVDAHGWRVHSGTSSDDD